MTRIRSRPASTVIVQGGGGGGGDSDADVLLGTINFNDSDTLTITGQPEPFGEQGSAMASDVLSASLTPQSLGGLTLGPFTLADDTGADELAIGGVATTALNDFLADMAASLGGTLANAFTAAATITANETTGTGARSDIGPAGGTTTWATPTSIQDEDDDVASIVSTGSALGGEASSDRLTASAFTPGGTPAGFTWATAVLDIRQLYSVSALAADTASTITVTVTANWSGGASDVLLSRVRDGGDQAALTTNTYNVATRMITEARTLSNITFDFTTTHGALSATTTFRHSVAFARLVFGYTASGIT